MSAQSEPVLIVGASAAGLRCAARLRRLEPDRPIRVIEQAEQYSVAACGMPYVLSGDITEAAALRRTGDGVLRDAAYFAAAKGIEVLAGTRALAIDPDRRRLEVEAAGERRELSYGELVLATGSRARRLPAQPDHPRVRSFHTLADLAVLDEGLKKGRIGRAVIVGAGLVGCELAEAFRALWDAEVCLLEAGGWPLPQVLDPEAGAIVARVLEANGVELHFRTLVDGLEATDDGVEVRCGPERFAGDVAVVAFGVEPAVDLARAAGVRLGPSGAIAVDERLATSVPHVWAAGDCIEVIHAVSGRPVARPLGSLANRQGRTLANVLAGRADRFGPVTGAGAIKVFDWNVAAVGLPLEAARFDFPRARAVWTSAHDRAEYWPEEQDLFLQLVFDADSRRVLGVQAVGPGECAKRIDVASQLLARGAGLAELARLEHAYAPPYAPAMEPLAQAAMVAENLLDGVEIVSPLSDLDGLSLLDVRHLEERDEQPLPAGRLVAVDQLELRSGGQPPGPGPWTVVCHRGLRSAEVARWLTGRGIEARYLGGGVAWLVACGKLPAGSS